MAHLGYGVSHTVPRGPAVHQGDELDGGAVLVLRHAPRQRPTSSATRFWTPSFVFKSAARRLWQVARRQALHTRAAELLHDDPERAAAEPELIAHHFTQAGLDDLAIEWWGKAGDQALRRSAFQEAIAHLGKAIAMADKAEEGKPRGEITATSATQRLKLQANYGQALAWYRGFSAEETKAAFTRANELSVGTRNSDERFVTLYGQSLNSISGGPLTVAQEFAETFLREAENARRVPETAVGLRCLGLTSGTLLPFAEAHTLFDDFMRDHRRFFGSEKRHSHATSPACCRSDHGLGAGEWL